MQGIYILSVQDILESLEGVAYVVAQDGTILACGGRHWAEFALTNGGETLADRDAVLGTNLFDSIRGRQVKDAYRALIARVLSGQVKQLAFNYRCDGPGTVREMRLSLTPVSAGQAAPRAVLYHAVLVRESARPRVDLLDPAVRAETAGQMHLPVVCLCSLCQEVRWPPRLPCAADVEGKPGEHERWVEAEEYYRLGGTDMVRVTHGICPDCERQVLRPLLGASQPGQDVDSESELPAGAQPTIPSAGNVQPGPMRMAASTPATLRREAFSTRLHG